MNQPVILEARERRTRFGRAVKWTFWLFQLAMILLLLGTCVAVVPYVGSEDPEVAAGAGLFAAEALGALWGIWPLGTLVMGVLLLATRGRRRLVTLPPETSAPEAAPTPPAPRRAGGSVPPTGSPPG